MIYAYIGFGSEYKYYEMVVESVLVSNRLFGDIENDDEKTGFCKLALFSW